MYYTSTRSEKKILSAGAIARGIAEDGGLFVPVEFPKISFEELSELAGKDYCTRACTILGKFLTDYTNEELFSCVHKAYEGTFENDSPAPLHAIGKDLSLLELWHGPTCAFKDMALQLLPHLLTTASRKVEPGKVIVILVATSGDTGKAALEGFADVPGTRIIVFYPRDGVSAMQKRQMTTQTGENVAVAGIEGNFDDAQTGVKKIFADASFRDFLAGKNMNFSSANSINFGRLAPQIVYYVSACCDLIAQGKLEKGDLFNVCVPTGNFGNILAAWYAKQMGVPIGKFICASNCNNVLTDFIRTGTYDRNRPFHTTSSPSMDILISSNLERLLYHLYGNDPAATAGLMAELSAKGKYTVTKEVLERLQQDFYGNFCNDTETQQTISGLFHKEHYLCDTHTAVAVNVYGKYVRETNDKSPCVIASTASPYKFAPAVLPAVKTHPLPEDAFEMLEELSSVSGMKIPAPLASLKDKKVLHPETIRKDEMSLFIKAFLEK